MQIGVRIGRRSESPRDLPRSNLHCVWASVLLQSNAVFEVVHAEKGMQCRSVVLCRRQDLIEWRRSTFLDLIFVKRKGGSDHLDGRGCLD